MGGYLRLAAGTDPFGRCRYAEGKLTVRGGLVRMLNNYKNEENRIIQYYR